MSVREYECDGAPICVECTPIGDLCYPDGLMSAADEARDRGMEPEDIIAARRRKGGSKAKLKGQR